MSVPNVLITGISISRPVSNAIQTANSVSGATTPTAPDANLGITWTSKIPETPAQAVLTSNTEITGPTTGTLFACLAMITAPIAITTQLTRAPVASMIISKTTIGG